MPPLSSIIAHSYDETDRFLVVTFADGRTIRYRGIPAEKAALLDDPVTRDAVFSEHFVGGIMWLG